MDRCLLQEGLDEVEADRGRLVHESGGGRGSEQRIGAGDELRRVTADDVVQGSADVVPQERSSISSSKTLVPKSMNTLQSCAPEDSVRTLNWKYSDDRLRSSTNPSLWPGSGCGQGPSRFQVPPCHGASCETAGAAAEAAAAHIPTI